jgi:membrane peptidoglycan carboxypeptidase
VQRPVRHAGLKAVGLLAALSLGAGLLAATATLPVIGVAGVVASDASHTFNTLPVNGLGQVPARSEILDSSGNVLAYYYPRDIFRVPVRYNQISLVMRNAIVAIEDYRYWDHGAFDLHGTLRALTATASGTSVQGGSDIAQQYVKNACLLTAVPNSPAQQECRAETVTRKLRELRIAANVEREMTKPQLLAAYLNVAYFDRDAYGVDVASELYYSEKPSQLTLDQSAMLAGLVNDPELYDPISNPKEAVFRRAEVLNAMAQHGYISRATAKAAAKAPLDLHPSTINQQTGCTSTRVRYAAYFCDYVLSVMGHDAAYHQAYKELLTVGGLKIYTTLNEQDQTAADRAVNYVLPDNNYYNPNHDVDTEVMVQPGTGYVRAIAINRHYGFTRTSPWTSSVDYAVNSEYDGGAGVQTGSSSKLFTLVTALDQGIPFNYSIKVKSGTSEGQSGFESCNHKYIEPFDVSNADKGGENGNIPLYYGTTASINAFYVALESRVGLCNVVKTAIRLGMTRADGGSLLRPVGKPGRPGYQPRADYLASFTLGAVNVAPMSMAGAYASVAARGIYCHPIAISQITDAHGQQLPVESAGCHRVMSKGVADAVSFVLQGVLQSGTAAGRGIGRPAAAKTGTANGGYYAAFAGYTPTLVGYVSVFNPLDPTSAGAMLGCPQSVYREIGSSYPDCPGQMYGDNAPGATWEYSFLRAALGPRLGFVYPPGNFLPGTGESPPAPKHKAPKGGKTPGGPGGGHH